MPIPAHEQDTGPKQFVFWFRFVQYNENGEPIGVEDKRIVVHREAGETIEEFVRRLVANQQSLRVNVVGATLFVIGDPIADVTIDTSVIIYGGEA